MDVVKRDRIVVTHLLVTTPGRRLNLHRFIRKLHTVDFARPKYKEQMSRHQFILNDGPNYDRQHQLWRIYGKFMANYGEFMANYKDSANFDSFFNKFIQCFNDFQQIVHKFRPNSNKFVQKIL